MSFHAWVLCILAGVRRFGGNGVNCRVSQLKRPRVTIRVKLNMHDKLSTSVFGIVCLLIRPEVPALPLIKRTSSFERRAAARRQLTRPRRSAALVHSPHRTRIRRFHILACASAVRRVRVSDIALRGDSPARELIYANKTLAPHSAGSFNTHS